MAKQCRTCTQVIINNEYFYINGSSLVSSQLQVYDLLLSFIPDFDPNLLPNSAICRNCMSTLHIAYTFKEQILNNELALQNYNEAETTETSFYYNETEEDGYKASIDSVTIVDHDSDQQVFANSNQQDDIIDSKIINLYIENVDRNRRKKRIVNLNYKCVYCDFASDNRTSLIMHNRIHSGEKPFQCNDCNYRAKRKSHLESHILNIHSNQSPLECGLCKKTFRAKQNLLKHQITHSGQKPYHCNRCDFKSSYRSSVVSHVKRVHMGITQLAPEKVFTCEICGKRFGRQSALNVHMRIHSDIKSHLCELCGKHFREIGTLRNHLLTHQEKMFKCDKCNYVANRKAHLRQHMQVYGDHEQLFCCNHCDHYYANPCNLSKHVKEVHTLEESEQTPTEVELEHAKF